MKRKIKKKFVLKRKKPILKKEKIKRKKSILKLKKPTIEEALKSEKILDELLKLI
jgi:hypothetical protein